MNFQPQKITAPDGSTLIVLAESDYLALLDAADIAVAERAMAESDFNVPAAVLDAMLAGKMEISAWREYRGLSQAALAERAGLLQPSLARMEAGKSRPRATTLAKLAMALDVPTWALTLRD